MSAVSSWTDITHSACAAAPKESHAQRMLLLESPKAVRSHYWSQTQVNSESDEDRQFERQSRREIPAGSESAWTLVSMEMP